MKSPSLAAEIRRLAADLPEGDRRTMIAGLERDTLAGAPEWEAGVEGRLRRRLRTLVALRELRGLA